MTRKLLFITGTRADFGKLKPLIKQVHDDPDFEYRIFATGMHMLAKYGNTVVEIERAGFRNLFMFINQMDGEAMEAALANTITGLTRYLHENPIDLIIIHGDRVEALAGAITGALRNILVAHVEGGELSGTVDDLMRHATSKLSHLHFVTNGIAKKRLQQLGEDPSAIFEIGSPNIDIMCSPDLPSLDDVRAHYGITFDRYAVAMLHPVTTELDDLPRQARVFAQTLVESGHAYVGIFPNNDLGSGSIIGAYHEVFRDCPQIRLFPSLRFEYFLTLLKHSRFLIGNSSAGVHEAPVYGVPTINIGTRQQDRFHHPSIFHADFNKRELLDLIGRVAELPRFPPCAHYGQGDSASKFHRALQSEGLWRVPKQKRFRDLNL